VRRGQPGVEELVVEQRPLSVYFHRLGGPRARRPTGHVSHRHRMVALLADAQRQGKLDEELTRLERIPLLVCDEVGYIQFDPQAASLMFMLVSRRYERPSMIVPSNKRFSAGEIFGDDMAATAMVEGQRLMQAASDIMLGWIRTTEGAAEV
jgi:DNA replication protein DnaC